MAVATGYTHDLFVSYAHDDDVTIGDAKWGFVTQLVSDLVKEAGRKVRGELDVWWDRSKLGGDSPVTPDIVGAASAAAAIVVIVSPAYLRSEWCRRERSTFLTALMQHGRSGGVFLVAIDDLDHSELPPEFQDLIPFNFWKAVPDEQTARLLRYDFPSDRELYYDRLSGLVQKVANYLNRLVAPETPHGTVQASPVPAPVGATAEGPAVVLAEVTDDLVQQREEVKAYLEQLGFNVLPKKRYSRDDVDLHCKQLSDDLENARLFVQLLGPLVGDRSDYPRGMAWLRYALAHARMPIERVVQWRDPRLEVDKIDDGDARELLGLPTVRSCGLQELKQEVAALLQNRGREPAMVRRGGPKCIFVNADRNDRAFAGEVAQWLSEQGYIVLESPTTDDPAEWRAEWESYVRECEALMLVFGRTRPGWVTQQFMQSRKVFAQREAEIELVSICIGPPPADSPGHDKLEDLALHWAPMKYFRCDKGIDPAELKRIDEFIGGGHAAAA
jgi:hypothetical protein